MIAANDHPSNSALREALDDPCQLRSLIAHAAGLLAHHTSNREARNALFNIAFALDDRPTMASITQEVAARFGVHPDDIRGPCRGFWAVHPRQEAMYLAHKTGQFSLQQIGNFFGGRDHTTVLHGVRAHERRAGL